MSATGLTKEQVRQAMKRLVAQHEINTSDAFKATRGKTPAVTCRGLLITIENYDCFDDLEGNGNTSSNTSSNSETTCEPRVVPHHYKKKEKERIPFIPPTVEEIISFCTQVGITGFDASGYVKKYSAVGWLDKNGNPIVDWRAHVGYCAGYKQPVRQKTVSAQQYGQRRYSEEELLAVSDDLLAEARQAREEGTK